MIPVKVLWQLDKKNRWKDWFQKPPVCVHDQFQTGGVTGELEVTDDQGSLASFDKDSNPSGQHLQVKSFGRWSDLLNSQLQVDQVAGIVSYKEPLAGEDLRIKKDTK